VRNERNGSTSTFRNHIFASAAAFVSSLRTESIYLPFIIDNQF
jgi:hypothetical protein